MGGTLAVKGAVISAIVAVVLLGAFVLSSSLASAQTPSPTPDTTQQSQPVTPTTPDNQNGDQQGTHQQGNCPNMGNDGSSSYSGGTSSSQMSFHGHRGGGFVSAGFRE